MNKFRNTYNKNARHRTTAPGLYGHNTTQRLGFYPPYTRKLLIFNKIHSIYISYRIANLITIFHIIKYQTVIRPVTKLADFE